MLLLLATLSHAACPATPSAVEAGIVAVERAFSAMNAAGVASAASTLEVLATCLDAPIDPALAVRMHGTAGLAAFVAGDSERAAVAFASARRIDPSWAPNATLVPKGHPIRALSTRIDPASLGVERLRPPSAGILIFDGVPARGRPDGTATVAQWVIDDRVVSGAYVWPGAPLPPYDVASGGAKTASPSRPNRSLGAWLGVTGASLLASGTCFYVAGRAQDAWEVADTGPEIVARYQENQVLVGLSATFGVVAVLGGVGAVASVAF